MDPYPRESLDQGRLADYHRHLCDRLGEAVKLRERLRARFEDVTRVYLERREEKRRFERWFKKEFGREWRTPTKKSQEMHDARARERLKEQFDREIQINASIRAFHQAYGRRPSGHQPSETENRSA